MLLWLKFLWFYETVQNQKWHFSVTKQLNLFDTWNSSVCVFICFSARNGQITVVAGNGVKIFPARTWTKCVVTFSNILSFARLSDYILFPMGETALFNRPHAHLFDLCVISFLSVSCTLTRTFMTCFGFKDVPNKFSCIEVTVVRGVTPFDGRVFERWNL
jgi:hypothetical protein